MEETIPPTRRRGFLRGTLAFLGGAFGLSATGTEPVTERPSATGNRLRFYVRTQSTSPQWSAESSTATDRRNRRGTLLASPNGETVGEYYAACLFQPGAFGVQLTTSPGVELQTFRMPEGTLFGAGANERTPEGATVHAVLGGTGRYAGARGTFSLTPLPTEAGAPAWVEIEINLLT